MRIDTAGFAVINQNTERAPRYVVKIEFAGVPATDFYITSHDDCALPDGILADDISYNTLKDLSGTSQRIDPIKAVSTIGAMNFSVIDYEDTITAKIHDEYDDGDGDVTVGDKGLRGKTVAFYVGEEGLEWDDYILVQTQIVQSVSLNDGTYSFKCADIQRTARNVIFDAKLTTLRNELDAIQTAIPTYNVSDFETLVHGSGYTYQPNETVGYIEIKDEIIAWRKKLTVAVENTNSDVSFSGNIISSTLIDLTEYDIGQQLTITGSGSNNGTYNVHPSTVPTANNLTVVETLVTESAGAAVNIVADVQFYDCTRGAHDTKAVEHTMSDPLPVDTTRRTKIEELVYLELPIPKLAYALLTGILYDSADVLPSSWHLNISTEFVATTEFISIGSDYWDITDDTAGQLVTFIGTKKGTGKKFIEEELLLLGGLYMPVLADGQLGLRRMTNILSNASPIRILDESNVLSIGALNHDMQSVYNQFDINWNYNRKDKKFTRVYTVLDGDSITRHGAAKPLVMKFQGLQGSVTTVPTLVAHTNGARDRYAGPPEVITVDCMFSCNDLEVGDVVSLQLENLLDFVTGGSINRSFEIQEIKTNWRTGTVSLKLFGSSQAAAPTGAPTPGLSTGFYTGAGTDISTVTTGSGTTKWTITSDSTIYGGASMSTTPYSVGTVTATNGDPEIFGSGTTWGATNMASINIGGTVYPILTINSNTNITLATDYTGTTGGGKTYTSYDSIYYYDGDLEVAVGVTLTIHNNIQLRVSGELIVSGTINGSYNGMQAPYVDTENVWRNPYTRTYPHGPFTDGLIGGIGNTQPPGMCAINGITGKRMESYVAPVTYGKVSSVEYRLLYNYTDTLIGLPDDLRGTSGGNGGGGYRYPIGIGWDIPVDGARGGAGLILVARDFSVGISSAINLHGQDGEITTNSINDIVNGSLKSSRVAHASNGAGGAPGGFYIVIDGNGSEDTSTVNQHYGVTLSTWPRPSADTIYTNTGHWGSYFLGLGRLSVSDTTNVNTDFTRVQHIDVEHTAAEDVPEQTTVASAITLAEVSAVNTTLNQTMIEVSVTAPTGSGPYIDNYKSSHIYAKNSIGDSWFDIGEVGPVGELAFPVAADGLTWEVKAHAISLAGVESEDYISDTITVTTQLETVIGTGNRIVTDPAPETNGGVAIDESGIVGYDGTGTTKVTIDATTGVITATDAILSGTITAEAGAIGGWDISSTAIEYGTAASHMELNPTTGIWMGADAIGSAPFSVSPAGALTVENATIGGWTVDANSLDSPDGRVILDATNNRIQVQNAAGTSYTRMNADGITGVDSVLGTVFRLPTDGTAPSFSSGIINSTVFNITSSGILETSSTVGDGSASGQGVRINNTGIKGYKINDTTPVFLLDATDGSLIANDATITGTITIGAGSTGVANLSDAGLLATEDNAPGSFANNLDATGFPLWFENAPDGNTLTTSTDAISGGQSGYFQSTEDGTTDDSSGLTTGAYIAVPENAALSLAGKDVRVTVTAKQPAAGASTEFAVAYSTSDTGNSGFFYFTPTTSWATYSFVYTVPAPNAGGADYVGIWGDTAGLDNGVLIDNISIGVDGADITADNTALDVIGQGDLATSDRTDLDYTDGADGTNAILQAGTTITGGGITLSAGGALKTLGKDSYNDTTAGIFMGYGGGAYTFGIGSSTNYLQWNGSTLTVNGTLVVGGTNLTATNTLNTNTTQTDVGLSNVDNQSALTIQAGTTASNVGLGSVSNLNPAGMTDSGLTTGVTINGGGITMSSGGAIKSYLKDSFTDITAGFYLGYDTTGTAGYKLNIGDADAFMKYDAASGLQVQTGSTTTKGIEMNPGGDNEFHFYGAIDQAGTVIQEVIRLGTGATPDWWIAEFGSNSTSMDKNALHAESYSGHGVEAYSYDGIASYSLSETDIAAYGKSGSGYGGYFRAISSGLIGCYGICSSTSGTGKGVYGSSASASGWDFYAGGTGINYGPFTGSHDGLVVNGTTYDIGDIIIDGSKIFTRNISNTIFENAISSTANQKGIIGVVASDMVLLQENSAFDGDENERRASVRPSALTDMPDADYATLMTTHKLMSFNAVGEGQINVCGEGGDLEAGDLIVASNTAGKGMKQADDIVRGYTVAKVREDVTFSSPSEVKMVACIYLCG